VRPAGDLDKPARAAGKYCCRAHSHHSDHAFRAGGAAGYIADRIRDIFAAASGKPRVRSAWEFAMDPFRRRPIADTALSVTQLGMGGASLGDMRESLPEAQASSTLEAAHASGIGYFDTSPWYGNGKSELRFGHVLRTKPRDSFVLSTKVGRVHSRPPDPDGYRHPGWAGGLPFEPRFDYTRDGVLKSYEMSLARLGLNRVEALLIHDLDPRHHRSEEGVLAALAQLDAGGGYRALAELKERGEISAVGAGINLVGMIPRFLERWPLDFFLVAMPYTLLDQAGLDELDMCAERGISVVIGAPYASGILARGPQPGATYNYRAAQPEVLAKAERIAAVCARHDTPRAAAALQFPFGHGSVVSVIPGPVTTEEVRKNLAWMRRDIPAALWDDLKRENLIRQDAPTPRG
jgi:D-threo-aldose 1-dehydrogenase